MRLYKTYGRNRIEYLPSFGWWCQFFFVFLLSFRFVSIGVMMFSSVFFFCSFCFVFNLCRLDDVHFHLVFMIIGHNSCFTSFSWKRFVWQFILWVNIIQTVPYIVTVDKMHINVSYMSRAYVAYMFLVKYETNILYSTKSVFLSVWYYFHL